MFKIIPIILATVFGAFTLLFGFLLIRGILKQKKDPGRKGMRRWLFNVLVPAGTALVLVFAIVANYLLFGVYPNVIDTLMTSAGSMKVGTTDEDAYALAAEIAEEGMTLLVNENGTLPLSAGTRINLLGYRAYDPVYSGTGSGSVDTSTAINIIGSLESAGFELNPALTEQGVYEIIINEEREVGFSNASIYIDEVSMDRYTGSASFESMKEYSDTAVVVIGRTGAEDCDLTAYKSPDGGSTYLQLSAEERALMEKASQTFDTLIVVYNGANAMELGFLDEYDVDACIWTGMPGANGFGALGKILSGEVNPSGALTDTYVYDQNANPANENFGENLADNSPADTPYYYVDYVEGIYVGYKWYETAYAESAVITNTKTGTTYDYSDYGSIVQFPFGYGLSYTEFEEELLKVESSGSMLDPKGTIRVSVQVTNTGDTAGKDIVEIYATVPYTSYDRENGVEKSAVTLIGYAKTSELAPGEKEVVTISTTVEDIASYDRSYDNGDGTVGTYMLDAGDYIISLRSDSHTVLDEAVLTLPETWFYSGAEKRSDDDQAAYNQFDDAFRGVYLSRADGFANYAEAMRSVSASVQSVEFDENPNAYDEAYDRGISLVKGVDYNAGGSLTLEDVKGLSYDDPVWDQLISQLSVSELRHLATGSIYGTSAVKSVGKPYTIDSDGPLGISSMFSTEQSSVTFPSEVVLAASWNNDLAYQFGSIIADQAHKVGVSGWYAPAMNIHRSAFGGRAFEYYSEDAVLSAGIAENEVRGATDGGMIVYIKHFALNEQETNRSRYLHTYANEQSIREIYLKPFEEAIKNGNANGIMSSMNHVGSTYSTCHSGLCTEVSRNEWGFRGIILTDMPANQYMLECVDRAIRSGTDMWLAMNKMDPDTKTDAGIYYLQQAAKHILYTDANAVLVPVEIFNWRLCVAVLDIELALLAGMGIVGMIWKNKKRKIVKIEKGETKTS